MASPEQMAIHLFEQLDEQVKLLRALLASSEAVKLEIIDLKERLSPLPPEKPAEKAAAHAPAATHKHGKGH